MSNIAYGPKLGKIINANIGDYYPDDFRTLLRSYDALVQGSVLSNAVTAPPTSPNNGDAYIIPPGATGAWLGLSGLVAVYSVEITLAGTNTKTPGWEYYTPKTGWQFYVTALSTQYFYNGSAWTSLSSVAIAETWSVSSQAGMLALPAHQGDMAIRSDVNETFVLTATNPAVLSNWVQLLLPASVVSVNSQTGVVSLASTNLTDSSSLVRTSTTINGNALSSNVALSASAITTGTLPHAQLPALVSGDIPNNAANTTGTAANLSGTPALPNGTIATTQAQGNNATLLATTAYVDTGLATKASLSAIPAAGSTPPAMDGTATVGTNSAYAHADHVHPSDTSRTQSAIVPNTVPTTGQVLVGNSGGTFGVVSVSGDALLTSAGALTVTQTGGTAFAASATIDTTNATNISSGTLNASRLPMPTTSTLGGVKAVTAVAHEWVNTISASGVPALTQPAFTDISGNIAATQINSGTNASSSTFHRGDGTWSTPSQVGGYSFRNRIINGAMDIDQRNKGAVFTVGTYSPIYTLDRWLASATGAPVTAQQLGIYEYSTILGPLQNTYCITGASGNTGVQVSQRIESTNIYDLAGSTVTLSVFLFSNVVTTVNWAAYFPSATDYWGGGATSFGGGSFTINGTPARYSATFTLATNNTNGLQIMLYIPALGAGGQMFITEVQLEAGSAVTPFERRPIGIETILAQRYYSRFQGANVPCGMGAAGSPTSAPIYVKLPVAMRVPPVISQSSSALSNGSTTFAVTSIGLSYSSPDAVLVLPSVASGLTANMPYIWTPLTSTGYVDFSSEL